MGQFCATVGSMKEKISLAIKERLSQLMETGSLPHFELPAIQVMRPTEESFGDYTTNIALIVAKSAGMNPRSLAELIVKEFVLPQVAKIEIAGPGHINFYLSDAAYSETLAHILKEGGRYGNSMQGNGVEVNNEFISANPTGPLHLGNGRGGFYADSLARVMKKAGYDVTNEYYVNDAGEQVMKLGHSILKDTEAVYGGEYIETLAERLQGETDDVRTVGEKGAAIVLNEMIKPIVQDTMRVHFDQWTSEKKLIEDGYVDKALAILKEKNLTFEQDGALWLRTTEFGDDKDRVLVKSDGSKTYFASDAGYILNKMERGFAMLIETWGADHHGYIGRFKAVARALGFTGEIHFLIVQLVKLVKDGVEVRMSKRAGNVVAIDELIEKVGHDVARFFFLMYSPDTHMNFDLGLAEEQSDKNPVYYVQYAHARLASIERKAAEAGVSVATESLLLLVHPKERLLIRELMAFPELVERMAMEKTVHQLPQYAVRLADRLHSFYADCKVIDEADVDLSSARLALIGATKTVLGETLRLMGVSAPEKM
ncbi:MAG: arginine--tRNA ligase [Candidatus Moraniibacteriota bacterium]|nr:MAG: arginine--tRNA ligase [Candidatus Moranbacteria bacterium]